MAVQVAEVSPNHIGKICVKVNAPVAANGIISDVVTELLCTNVKTKPTNIAVTAFRKR